ncbi:hypothetical protein NHX12_019881 [Muraenolepis orangiensis]|uniref:Chloride channel CLIC-like protein 1 n=1 Tax=Muraenolepis orangiensis TaxID=630683 RepID=A0A9Q0EUD3_9TELE|nr:hypothetical protein NHX12_019881 [Muraenolepis orangiensis]
MPITYPDVPTKRREQDTEGSDCSDEVSALQRQVEEQRKSIASISQQPTYSPTYSPTLKRFLTRILKLINKAGLPTDNEESFYNAKVKITRQGVSEIQKFLESGDNQRNAAVDDALGQLLIDVRTLDHEVWAWRFEDSFGVEVDTVLKVFLCILVIVAIICTQLWSVVSWFIQFKRVFAVCFFVSIVWNWFYLYKIAFAEHQGSLAKMDSVYGTCTGVKKIDWSDSLKEWFRSTWTLQDDPCKRYYELLMVNPVLLVPPTKAISVTITTFFTEPLKHIGQGISEFLRALLKDLPITLQLPVLITIVVSILVVMYGGVQAVFQHGIMAPLRGIRGNPPNPAVAAQPPHIQIQQAQVQPPAQIQQAQVQPPALLQQPYVQAAQPPPAQQITADPGAVGAAPQPGQEKRAARGAIRRRRPQGTGEEAAAAAPPSRVSVETLGDESYSQDETDSPEPVGGPPGQGVLKHAANPPEEEEEEEEEEEDDEEVLRQAAPRAVVQGAKKRPEDKPSDLKPNVSQDNRKDVVTQPAGIPGATGEQSLNLPPEFSSLASGLHVTTVGSPVQETSPTH